VLSRDTFQRCIDSRTAVPWDPATASSAPEYSSRGPPPPAVFNNYGLLEMDNFNELHKARALFVEAVRVADSLHGPHTNGYEVMVGNLDKITRKIRGE
jgi:hypothetical protein